MKISSTYQSLTFFQNLKTWQQQVWLLLVSPWPQLSDISLLAMRPKIQPPAAFSALRLCSSQLCWFRIQTAWIQILTLIPVSCVTFGRPFILSVLQFLHLEKGSNNSTCFLGMLWGLVGSLSEGLRWVMSMVSALSAFAVINNSLSSWVPLRVYFLQPHVQMFNDH